MKVASTTGYRLHLLDVTCWCRPTLDGDVVVHKHTCGWLLDDRFRMTNYPELT